MAGPRKRRTGRVRTGLAGALLLAALATPTLAEEFEVLVLRGSEIARVSGDGSGPLSEVTVREDPYPPPPAPQPRAVAERASSPEVVIHIDRSEPAPYAVPVWRYPLHRPLLRPPHRNRLHDWGARHQHGSYRLGPRPPRSALRSSPR